MVSHLATALPDSFSVSLSPHRFYRFSYDYQLSGRRGDWVRSRIVVPFLFGRLAARAAGFMYVGGDGYLVPTGDEREWEFSYLARKRVRICCVFTGNDIRSPRLTRNFERETGLETIMTYLEQLSSVFASDAYDLVRKRRAEVADRFADVIFNAPIDQLSYLTKTAESFPYFFPDDRIVMDDVKHARGGPRLVVHAPSSPIIKGTQVVRAAVKRLKAEGYDFEYVELVEVSNDEVLETLRRAHIVLNEFYAFVPGVFGVEAMASGCALLTSADERVETSLPRGSNDAWVVTPASDVYANLKTLLDNPGLIEKQAATGRRWVLENATMSASGRRVRGILDTVLN